MNVNKSTKCTICFSFSLKFFYSGNEAQISVAIPLLLSTRNDNFRPRVCQFLPFECDRRAIQTLRLEQTCCYMFRRDIVCRRYNNNNHYISNNGVRTYMHCFCGFRCLKLSRKQLCSLETS